MSGQTNNVVGYLQQAADQYGARTALVLRETSGRDASVTFARLWERVDRVGVGLQAAGLSRGDRAVMMVPMSIDLYVLMLAVLKVGAIAVFVDPWVGRKQIAAFVEFAEVTAWIGVPKSHILRWLESSLRRIPLTVSSGSRCFGLAGQHSLAELERHAGNNSPEEVSMDDTAMITFTSGSSGLPKGVNRTHRFLAAQHAALQQEFPQHDQDVDMPMFPVFALNNLGRGVTSVIPAMDFRHVDRVDGATIADQMAKHGVTTCTASPPFIDRLVEWQQHAAQGIALRRMLTGGAPVADPQLRAWREAWPATELVVVYGSTEAEPVAHVDADERLAITATQAGKTPGYCIGVPSELVQVRVIRICQGVVDLKSDGWDVWELPTGEAGELVVSGNHVARNYFQNAEATAENKLLDHDGTVWHRMGDTGYLDHAGRLWLVGRVHSTIFRAGKTVHPQLVEQAAMGDDHDVRRVAALGVSDESLGERVVVVVESNTNDRRTLGDVQQRIEDAGLTVDEVCFASQPLPLDPRHRSKVDYQALRDQLQRAS